jgi:glycosyltransferase involved in cell wall biosynthesis
MALAGARILQVIPRLDAGGAERTTVEVAAALQAAGARALVASEGGRLSRELEAAGAELIEMPHSGSKNPLTMLGHAGWLKKLIRARKVDLVHARSRAPAWSALWAARSANVKFVTTYHGVYTSGGGLKRLYNSVMARGDAVIANSEFTAAHVRAEHPFAASKLITIPRGVDMKAFRPDAVSKERIAQLARLWRIRPDKPDLLILLPGRMTSWKGHREAIEAAWRIAKRDLPPWRMIFVGDAQGRSDYCEALRAKIANAGLEDRIELVGHCDDMPAAFSLADLVIAPSNRAEAFGRVAAEAGAMGKPVIGSDIGGQREIIVSGETGWLTPPGDAVALADAMASVLAMGPEKRAAMGRAAEARIASKFTAAALQRATLDVYDRLIGRQA